ncbi:MAG: isopeptide-forming domain-containing fimbrial protein, partial [Leucobacter sp.]|nr:isopeptide-forming domain-containing fimbrial protein [Leucobacter sp.]
MLNIKKRGLLASAGALVTTVALAFGGAAAAQAATVDTMPTSSGLVITKLEQPKENRESANGLPQTGLPDGAISDVTFEAYQVPLTKNPLTNEGQKEIAGISLAAAKKSVEGKSSARTGVTDDAGEIHWQSDAVDGKKDGENLEAGLWLVRETNTPAGVVAAGDFLVAVPLTHPTELNNWLDTIYVYPKNHTVKGEKTVENADQLKVGETVTWTITVDNPSPRDPATGTSVPADMLQIVDELDENFLTTAVDGSGVEVTAPKNLVKGTDYKVSVVSEGGKSVVTIDFEAAGLKTLAAVAPEDVQLTLKTVVKQTGVIENSARFTSSKTQTEPKEIPGTDVKYGEFAILKTSEAGSEGKTTPLKGAEFMVFASEADAKAALNGGAALDNALKPAVTVPGYDQKTGIWTSNGDGRIDITGLRYSGYADGESFG